MTTIPESRAIKAWHFVRDDKRIDNDTHHHGRARIVRTGLVLRVPPPIVLCERGLHGSERIIDALQYAPGALICRTSHWGEVVRHDDKLASEYRRVEWMLDGTTVLREFACDIAESALLAERAAGREPDRRSWEAIRVTRAWMRGVCDSATWGAASAAAWAAARDAAMAAAWDAARAAASAAAWAAARAAAWDAARAAAMAAARDAAWDAAWDAHNTILTQSATRAHAAREDW